MRYLAKICGLLAKVFGHSKTRLGHGPRATARQISILVWLEQVFQDIRYGLRLLHRNSGFTAVVILTLALGIGMNTAVFSVVNTVLLRPLAYPNATRLIWLAPHDLEWGDSLMSRTDYSFLRDQARLFERMTAYLNQDLALFAAGEASQERITSVTGDF